MENPGGLWQWAEGAQWAAVGRGQRAEAVFSVQCCTLLTLLLVHLPALPHPPRLPHFAPRSAVRLTAAPRDRADLDFELVFQFLKRA